MSILYPGLVLAQYGYVVNTNKHIIIYVLIVCAYAVLVSTYKYIII
jgi:hypothetical protein